ncbi:MAG TPA: zf-HC2 domain-containing protein [Actinomycetota bacterium]|nr:zf-HC2 domain-containing protein [Actinomycetota bacterium]
MIRRPAEHNPERDVAAYVSGDLTRRDLHRFEAHLLECEDCWREVRLNREGRRLAERAREAAPARLREDVRAAVALFGHGPRRRPRHLVVAAFAAAAVGVAITLTVVSLGPSTAQPPQIAAALTSYRSQEVPQTPPERVAPDLTATGLELVWGGAMRLGSTPADVFAYREPSGARVLLFLSSFAFPEAIGATQRGGMAQGWTARADGLSLFCGSRPVSFLVVGTNPALLHRVERALTILAP